MSYRIASFNMHNLSLASGRDLKRIADIIKENQLDIVAMQEVLAEGRAISGIPLKRPPPDNEQSKHYLCKYLGRNWDFRWCNPEEKSKNSPYLGKDSRGEGYGYLWNTNKFELPTDKNGKELYPKCFSNYHINKETGQLRLIRDPAYAQFTVKRLKTAEIRLINTHIVSGKPNSQNLGVEVDHGAILMRKKEFEVLVGQIYPRICNDHKSVSCKVPYTIILGDYNLNLRGSGVNVALIPETVFVAPNGIVTNISSTDARIMHTLQSELTTLKKDEPGYASNYDHFTMDEAIKNKVVKGSCHAIDAVRKNVGMDCNSEEEMFCTYKKTVSDHIPIVIEIGFK